ncbi:unnamed protein product [Paramecium octaurelia]|uniref:Uncharacterized protein n=1 Tax=Paramecium octaurelia TaxID=43137 RepID=A0A8S1XNU3_PAROT|nr:unnamed protein product [Paramecium octaurelia]
MLMLVSTKNLRSIWQQGTQLKIISKNPLFEFIIKMITSKITTLLKTLKQVQIRLV